MGQAVKISDEEMQAVRGAAWAWAWMRPAAS